MQIMMRLMMLVALLVMAQGQAAAGQFCGPQSAIGRWVPDHFVTPMSNRRAEFGRACEAHDACYGYLGVDKDVCDAQFAQHLRLECDWAFRGWQDEPSRMACFMAASVYVANVRQFGEPYFAGSQQGAMMRLWMHRQIQQAANVPLPVTRGDVHAR
jgi:hypothetical protein